MKLHHIIARHVLAATLAFRVWYPAHEQRTESTVFAATKRHLVEYQNEGCWVCGTRKDREVHHWWVEWAFANAVDWKRMRTLHPDFDWSKFKEPADFVDSLYNCRVLCVRHHRLQGFGIHNLPFPVWIEQRHKPGDWKFAAPVRS